MAKLMPIGSVMARARRYLVHWLFASLVFLAFANPGLAMERKSPLKILAIGDSLMAWNGIVRGSIPDVIELASGGELLDRSQIASFVLTGGLERQYVEGDWDWVVVTDGGNDLWLGCGCQRCDATLDKMISQDGSSGRIPSLLSRILRDDARILYVGYLRSPGIDSLIDHCATYGTEFERRIDALAASQERITFLSLADLVPYGDRTYHALDMIHPSRKASFDIGYSATQIILGKQ